MRVVHIRKSALQQQQQRKLFISPPDCGTYRTNKSLQEQYKWPIISYCIDFVLTIHENKKRNHSYIRWSNKQIVPRAGAFHDMKAKKQHCFIRRSRRECYSTHWNIGECCSTRLKREECCLTRGSRGARCSIRRTREDTWLTHPSREECCKQH